MKKTTFIIVLMVSAILTVSCQKRCIYEDSSTSVKSCFDSEGNGGIISASGEFTAVDDFELLDDLQGYPGKRLATRLLCGVQGGELETGTCPEY